MAIYLSKIRAAIFFFFFFFQCLQNGFSQNFCISESEGSDGYDFAADVDADPSGNFFITGGYRPNAEFGGLNYPGNGSYDFFLAKYNASGSLAWNQHMGGSNYDNGRSVFWGPDNHVYAAGSIKLGVEPPASQPELMHLVDALFVKYDSSGSLVWMKLINGDQSSDGYKIFSDSQGRAFCTGIYTAMVFFDNDTLNTFGGYDLFLVVYDSAGNELWTKGFGSTYGDAAPMVGTDNNGFVYCAGAFTDTLFTDDDTLAGDAGFGSDIFIVKMNMNGQIIWSRVIASTADASPAGIAVLPDGSFYLTGNFYQDINLGGNINSLGTWDGFLAKFDSSGVIQWSQTVAGTGYTEIKDLDTDPMGNAYLTGYGNGTQNIAGSQFSNGGLEDFFFASFSPAGVLRLSQQAALPNSQLANGIAVDAGELIYIAGSYTDSMSLGDDSLFANSNSTDIFWTRWGDSAQLVLDSLSQGFGCEGDSFNVYFTGRGCFDGGNQFQAQLSDNAGSFSSPTSLGEITALNGGMFQTAVPNSIVNGNGYRVRVVSTFPQLVSNDNGTNLPLSQSIAPVISGDSVICSGDTVFLDAGPGFATYHWNTGDSTQITSVTTPGNFTVTVTNSGGCITYDSHLLGVCTEMDEKEIRGFIFFPNPAFDFLNFETWEPEVTVKIFSSTGELAIEFMMTEKTKRIETNSLHQGIYFIQAATARTCYFSRVSICR